LKVLGVQTSDFSAYYDLVQALRARGVPFVTIAAGEPVPPHVGVLITTRADDPDESSAAVVLLEEPHRTIDAALRILEGAGPFRRCVIGVDPGERPGVAILADGRVVRLVHAPNPEAVRGAIDEALATIPAERFVVRIGNGAPTFRDRILQTIASLPVMLEMVDESHSTPVGTHGQAERDTQAATNIALTPGTPLMVSDLHPVRPTEGELRDIQRKSRLVSEGQVTISRSLARHVALGRLTLDEAVARQQGRA
jgi:hypothetical protein